jgi:CrcB protein
MKDLLLVGLGGFVGSSARYLVSKLNISVHFFSLPVGTLAVNILGSFLIGILIGLSAKNDIISDNLRLLLMVGFCGGFTTFSTFSAENLTLIQNGQIGLMLVYTAISISFGLSAVYIGYLITQ